MLASISVFEESGGTWTVANGQLAYALFLDTFTGPRWEALVARGARVQRPLWASTSTKNPEYPDTLYVDTLIGPNTVNTIPPATLEAFQDHGTVADTLTQGLDEGTEFDYLDTRIRQVAYLGEKMKGYGIPMMEPFGGHAIFIDAKKFLPNIPKEEYIAQALATEIYLEGGVRAVEIGTLLADRDPDTRENRYPELELRTLSRCSVSCRPSGGPIRRWAGTSPSKKARCGSSVRPV